MLPISVHSLRDMGLLHSSFAACNDCNGLHAEWDELRLLYEHEMRQFRSLSVGVSVAMTKAGAKRTTSKVKNVDGHLLLLDSDQRNSTMEERVDAVDQSLQESLLGDECANDGDEVSAETTKIELKALLKLSAPLMVQLSSQYAIIIVNQYFIGHLGPAPLAAAAIGNTVSDPAVPLQSPLIPLSYRLAACFTCAMVCSGSTSAGISCWECQRLLTHWARKRMGRAIQTVSFRVVYRLSPCFPCFASL